MLDRWPLSRLFFDIIGEPVTPVIDNERGDEALCAVCRKVIPYTPADALTCDRIASSITYTLGSRPWKSVEQKQPKVEPKQPKDDLRGCGLGGQCVIRLDIPVFRLSDQGAKVAT